MRRKPSRPVGVGLDRGAVDRAASKSEFLGTDWGQNPRLGDYDETGPFMPLREPVEQMPKRDTARLLKEAAWRMVRGRGDTETNPELSRVEKAMRRNAPDLAGLSAAELAADRARRDALMARRWPRPRLLSLILVITVAAVVPDVALRLLVWAVVLFLISAVVVGPERVRDSLRFAGDLARRYWQHELRLAQKLVRLGN